MTAKTAALPTSATVIPMKTSTASAAEILEQYRAGPVPFLGTQGALYERHLLFDRVIDPQVASARERFARPAEGRFSARVQCLAGRAADPGQ